MAYYSAGVLICLCSYFICWLAVVSDGNDARNGYKGRYGRQPAHYEIIVPLKVTETGEFISHTIPHHYKRSYYGKRSQKDMGPDDMVHYIVPIAGEKHHLQLLPSNNIASPGMVVEIQDNKGISHRDIHKLRNILCHYTGSVRGQDDSRAALSTCYGLSGYVRTKRGYFFIEPAAGHNPLSGIEHPHLLYEREMDPPKLETNCETRGNLAHILSKRATSNNETEEAEEKENPTSRNASELHIEALVVLDKTLLNYHKEIDVENYVLTVFNMAHDLYHDASLNTNINLAIVRMIRLEEEEHKLNLAVNRDAKKTLEFFLDWQNKMNPGDDTHPNHHDVAVLLTRVDICGDDDNCGLLGASVLGGICTPKEQAAICEDNGLRLGFVIAHEIAHTLAIPHDTPKDSGCNATLPDGLSTVMNPSVNIRTVEWSSCSPKFLDLFIDQGFGKCLYDPPTDHNFGMPDILPGVMYGGDFQCRELLGPNAALCDTGIECNNLICYVEDKGCVETHTAAAPGTNCGEKKWCYRGKCLEEGQRPGAIDGGWGAWSNWSECSRSCGSGVTSRERHCDKPAPAHGGKYCVGEHKNHKICNTEPCDVLQPSFRNVQCAEFNDWVYPEDNKLHSWNAYYMTEDNPCVLFCVNDEGEVASLRPRVIDGTKCVRGMRDICIDGLCKEIPCDLDLESNAVEDWCGVCRGDGTSCTLIVGERFVAEEAANNSRLKLIDIPSGSVNIKVEETEPSEAKIQVASEDGKTILIEGNTMGMFNLSGVKAWLGNIRTKQEALTLPGPIKENISIWIETLANVTIKYSYGVKETTKRTPQFDWDYLEWSKCSAQCGPGTQEAVLRCLEKTSGLVDDKYCKDKTKPKDQIRPCEITPCIPRWMIGDWQECNCHRHKRIRVVKCIKPTGDGEGEADVISDSECVRPKPKHKEFCSCKNKALIRRRGSGQKEIERLAEKFQLLMDEEPLIKSPMSRKRSMCMLANIMNETDCNNNNNNNNINSNNANNNNNNNKNNNHNNNNNNNKKQSKPHFTIVIDKEDPKDVKLTLHTDPPNEKPVNENEECITNHPNGPQELEGKEALEFLNKEQKDFSNNKMRI